jgi:hypothetical protein
MSGEGYERQGVVEANEIPAAVIVRWPSEPSVVHPHRFPSAAGDGEIRPWILSETDIGGIAMLPLKVSGP